MRKTKEQKGITLIALIITIIVLLLLAVVAISAVQDDGIINYAKNAREDYGKAGVNENTILEGYLDKIADNLPVTMEDAMKPKMLTKTVNSDATDKYGNKIVIPAGFKILVDGTTGYTEETIDVTKGIVIEDAQGNQFVWVPVGKVYYSETEYKTITLGRYENFTANAEGEYTPIQLAKDYSTATAINTYYTEDTEANHNEVFENEIAEDIGAFVTSATTKGGYYIARYEAGNSSNTLVCKANQTVYGNVTQAQASELSKNMYTSNNFKSDLVNSYAWDTAIIFIQTLSTEEDASNYANLNKCTERFKKTGENMDKYCNIHDMSGNAYELSTETSSYDGYPYVRRGGYFSPNNGSGYLYAKTRDFTREADAWDRMTFRPLLYVTL